MSTNEYDHITLGGVRIPVSRVSYSDDAVRVQPDERAQGTYTATCSFAIDGVTYRDDAAAKVARRIWARLRPHPFVRAEPITLDVPPALALRT